MCLEESCDWTLTHVHLLEPKDLWLSKTENVWQQTLEEPLRPRTDQVDEHPSDEGYHQSYHKIHKTYENGDEPHGSLFVYFRIFALLVDDHVIESHVTGVTVPIPTFGDQFRSFLVISNDFYLWLTSHKHCKPRLGTM